MRDFDSSSNSISKPERYRGNYRCELLNKQPPDGHILCIPRLLDIVRIFFIF